jgi:xanthine dehydrogenase iron-sulfur cluster and FAD-binding subunit A
MLLTAQELLADGEMPSRDEIREHLSGNYCRCTGYHAIVDAVETVAQARLSSSSFRGAAVGREAGIQNRTTGLMGSEPGAAGRPGTTAERRS